MDINKNFEEITIDTYSTKSAHNKRLESLHSLK